MKSVSLRITGFRIFFLILTLVFLSLITSCKEGSRTETNSGARIGGRAPDFSLRDLQSETVRLSDFKGKVILLEFWATWCTPCIETIPVLIRIQEKYRDRGFTVLAVSLDSGQDIGTSLSDFKSEYGLNYPVLIGNDEIKKNYKLISIPTSFVISRDGVIMSLHMGAVNNYEEKISEDVEKLL